ncbi:hypothetical protein BO82DRAFT_356810 [Aspergillus uvarum CBS 121591]|uniref:Transcription factor domain-containing protein n=1 Tax=Aspergillus uvarum CBS 121591 TaxID=1448315 RepID=A0A319CK26_9EURO|nr:hypothetical protein BO82DRAFT_356810 [Aspergillus uvarum CBS 121591]PYH79013.1 hypothetical protein BO82DRAFT_356810 [Aspergillus uvarum CBS 121591]
MHRIEAKFDIQVDSASEIALSNPSPELEALDDESNTSDILATERPSHLQSLFQNNWLSLDSRQKDGQQQERKERPSSNLLNTAREALQKLIPPKHEVVEMYNSAFEWLKVLHAFLPQPFIAQSKADALGKYDRMIKPDVDTMALASWMLTLAITAQQTPRDGPSTPEQSEKWLKQFELSQAISDAVESTIISHDRLLGTTTGLMLCMHWTRLQLPQGNFQKAWVRLRHVSAIAELMGLPRAFQASQRNRIPTTNDEVLLEKTQLWETISAVDRLLGMVLNLPPDTRWHRPIKDEALTVGGVVQPHLYFAKLVNIAGKVQALDELNTAHESTAQLTKSTFEMVEELRSLASQTPESWWTQPIERIKPDNIVQAIHYYVLLRAYMPLALRQTSIEEPFNPQLACFKSCESVIQRNAILLEAVPPGFFFYTMMELHTFTATVILILLSQTSKISQQFSLHVDKAKTEREVQQVIDIMRKRINNTPTSRIAESAVNTLSSLTNLLHEDENVTEERKLILDVPLLGKVHIQRNVRTAPIPTTEKVQPSRTPSRPPSRTSHQPLPPSLGLNAASSSRQDFPQWDDLSWFIEEDPAYFLQDTLMEDTFDQTTLWYNGVHNFSFGG